MEDLGQFGDAINHLEDVAAASFVFGNRPKISMEIKMRDGLTGKTNRLTTTHETETVRVQ